MSAVFRPILLFLVLFVTGQTWGISVTHHQYDAGNVGHDVDEYVYDATVNLQICCGNQSQGQNAHDGHLLALIGDFLATKKTTQSGISVSRHSVNQKINRGVRSADELDALKNPLDIRPVKIDQFGRPSQRHIGRKAEVAVNPETGKVVSVNPTSTKKAERLLRRLEGQ